MWQNGLTFVLGWDRMIFLPLKWGYHGFFTFCYFLETRGCPTHLYEFIWLPCQLTIAGWTPLHCFHSQFLRNF